METNVELLSKREVRMSQGSEERILSPWRSFTGVVLRIWSAVKVDEVGRGGVSAACHCYAYVTFFSYTISPGSYNSVLLYTSN